ncbi:hypothetical protein PISMIDRAFT_530213 [Pisolithus microcarpus 441]|uniref:Uncharacterized protein n=1 Tax=Pisolithus microcarpus 441 TaxID=765257 RepID=A0A0C9YZ91_9AGAM|nr:hypothetical protein PISMIDRAFT_530213 [Pisolithus microcarpus 441]
MPPSSRQHTNNTTLCTSSVPICRPSLRRNSREMGMCIWQFLTLARLHLSHYFPSLYNRPSADALILLKAHRRSTPFGWCPVRGEPSLCRIDLSCVNLKCD